MGDNMVLVVEGGGGGESGGSSPLTGPLHCVSKLRNSIYLFGLSKCQYLLPTKLRNMKS